MNKIGRYLSVFLSLFLALVVDCSDDSTNPVDDKYYAIPDVVNIVWTLAVHDTVGRKTDVSFYEPFHLVYDNDGFWGDDGCNTFTGTYEVKKGQRLPGEFLDDREDLRKENVFRKSLTGTVRNSHS